MRTKFDVTISAANSGVVICSLPVPKYYVFAPCTLTDSGGATYAGRISMTTDGKCNVVSPATGVMSVCANFDYIPA